MKPHQDWIMASFGRIFKEKDTQAKAEMCFNKSLIRWKEMGNPEQEKLMEKELDRYRKTSVDRCPTTVILIM